MISILAINAHTTFCTVNEQLTPDTALRLSHYLGATAEFWLNWQGLYDLQQIAKRHVEEYNKIKKAA